MQNLILNILMSQCPRCSDRLEFTAGRCARSSINHNHNHNGNSEPINLQDLETKLVEWVTKNKEEIKLVLAEQHELNVRLQKISWRDYDTELEKEVREVGYKVTKFTNGLCNLIPVLGLIHNQDDTNNSNNHLIHILKQLCYS